jgi:hypothetical protein
VSATSTGAVGCSRPVALAHRPIGDRAVYQHVDVVRNEPQRGIVVVEGALEFVLLVPGNSTAVVRVIAVADALFAVVDDARAGIDNLV